MNYKTNHSEIVREWDKFKSNLILNINDMLENSNVDRRTLDVMLALIDKSFIREERKVWKKGPK